MSGKNDRSKDVGENFGEQIQNNVYEVPIDFDKRSKDGDRRLNTPRNAGILTVKKWHLIIGVGIQMVIIIVLIAVSGAVVYNMAKCEGCQHQQSSGIQQQIDKTDLYATYIRWGRTICPNESTTVYTGYASGSHYTDRGGTSHTICLPRDPQYGNSFSGRDYSSLIYNSEYQSSGQTQAIFGEDMEDHDVPCAVCEVKGKSTILMIPARMECFDGWTKEYSGYLMTEYHSHYRSSMKCVDETPENIRGQGGNNDGDLFYFVEPAGTIPDPPYTRGVELTCVVCTK